MKYIQRHTCTFCVCYNFCVRHNYFVIDLFSGSGGSALGFKSAGFTVAAAVEINKLASESFQKNFPETKVFTEDICGIDGKRLLKEAGLSPSDRDKIVILACPPCQGFSTARRTEQRIGDPRNLLIMEFVRLVKEIRPVAFVMENVPGLAKGIGRSVFVEAINQLSAIGYNTTEPKVVEAADYGVPQKRKRLVLMGTRVKKLNLSLPEPTNRKPQSENDKLPLWKTVRETISDLRGIAAGTRDSKDPLHLSAHLSDINLQRISHTPKNGGSRSSWPDNLVLACHKSVNGYTDVYGRMLWDAPSPTITGGCAMLSKGRFGHPEQNRAISLREAARLQSFPDNFIFVGNFGEIAKQIGNAVPPKLAQEIAKSLLKTLGHTEVTTESVNALSEHSKPSSEFSVGIYQAA